MASGACTSMQVPTALMASAKHLHASANSVDGKCRQSSETDENSDRTGIGAAGAWQSKAAACGCGTEWPLR